jgi:hypothetical protein
MALVSLLLFLQAADVTSLIRDLDDDAYEVRRKAFGELVKAGKAALPALHEAARNGPSLEVRDAAPRIVDAILARIREDFIVEHASKPKNLACGGLTFYSQREASRRTQELAGWFPDCELLVGWYGCMHRARMCDGTWIVGLSRMDGETFTVLKELARRKETTPGDAAVLARYLRPARDEADAAALQRLLGNRE